MAAFGLGRTVPIFLQTEATECGLCSLAMVAHYHGYRTDLASLRLRFPISRKGATLDSLVRIASAVKLESRPLRLELGHLDQLQLPCVIHWNMDHFVVLTKVTRTSVVIHDPALGVRSFTTDEFSKYFTGIALELTPASDFEPAVQQRRFTLRGLMGNITGLKRGLAQVLVLAFALETLTIALPFFLQWVVDQAIVSADRELLNTLALGFGLLILVQGTIGAVRSSLLTSLSMRLNFQWLGNVFAHLLKLPLDYFEKRHIGNTMASFSAITLIQRTLTTGFVQVVVDGIMVIGTCVVMLLYSAQLFSIAMGAVVLYGLMRMVLFHSLRAATAEQIIHAARQATHFYETASGIQSVRLFGKGDQRRAGWLHILADQFNAELRIQRVNISYETAQTLLFGMERIIVIWLAAHAVLAGQFTVGMLFAFIAYKEQFSRRLAGLIDKYVEFKMLHLHGERVADIVLSAPEQQGPGGCDEIIRPATPPRIEIHAASYRYSPTEPYVFEDIDLTIEPGECIAITGVSGSGKTSLLKVMLGLLTPEQGGIRIDGKPLQHIGLTAYRSMIGTVMQEDRMFSGSIAENICFFDPSPDWERIRECATLAAIATEIEAMPMAYNTITGDSGIGISGGQKQRILLARALYRQPLILVLDEATSELDVGNEKMVNAAIRNMGLTRIIAAHRPETIAMADKVFTMEKGRLRVMTGGAEDTHQIHVA